VLLALLPPQIAPSAGLPADVAAPAAAAGGEDDEAAAVREALRLRVRWLQELTARAAQELGRRLASTGRLVSPQDVADLSLDELSRAVRDPQLGLAPVRPPAAAPLPARFRLGDRGLPVPVVGTGAGTGAGGGRGTGPVHTGPVHAGAPPEGSVLVVRTLDPSLAPCCPAWPVSWPRPAASWPTWRSWRASPACRPSSGWQSRRAVPPGTVVEVDGDTGQVVRREEGG
jgi:hypothetical protein